MRERETEGERERERERDERGDNNTRLIKTKLIIVCVYDCCIALQEMKEREKEESSVTTLPSTPLISHTNG